LSGFASNSVPLSISTHRKGDMLPFGINLILMISVGSILFNFKVARSQSIPSTLPPAEPASSVPDMLIVRIDSSGQLYVEQNLVTQEQLFQEVLNFNQSVQCGLVVVAASNTTSYSSVVSVIDTLRQAAVQRIALGFPLYRTHLRSFIMVNNPPTAL
jgi:biopolymer transport protein ExbD